MPARPDIVFELLEISKDILTNIKQQLVYYRSGVYKVETAKTITAEINKLRNVLELFCDEKLLEPLEDYYATDKLQLAPGECSLTMRVSQLLTNTLQQLQRYDFRNTHFPHSSFLQQVKKHRRDLLALSPQGSRRWLFFSSL